MQYVFGIALAGTMGAWVLLGMVRFGSQLKGVKTWGSCPTERDDLAMEDLRERFQRAWSRLRQWQEAMGGNRGAGIPLVLSESVCHPVLFGLNPPRIFVPFALVDQGIDLQGDLSGLARLADRKAYRVCMILWWWAQFDLVLLPMGNLLWRALERESVRETKRPGAEHTSRRDQDPLVLVSGNSQAGVGLGCRSSIPLVKEGINASRLLMLLASVTILVFGCLWGIQWSGGLRFHEFLELIMNDQIVGFSVHGFDPTVEFKAIPGEGGILPDGLRVDTTKADARTGCATVRVPLGLFDHEKWIPFGAKAVRVRLSWRVLERHARATELPAVKLASSEQGVIDADGQQKLWTYYTRNVFLAEDGLMEGTVDLPILVHSETRVLPESRDVIYGPILFIPEGWRIEFRHYLVDQIEASQVPPVPVGEGERFVAWYHRNGFKPASIDLQWRETPGETPRPW